jgi:hypothetical protein
MIKTILTTAGLFTLMLLGTACGGGGYYRSGYYVNTPPPPPRVEYFGGPRPGYAWRNGYYSYRGNAYRWNNGRWVRPPRAGARWAPGQWVQTPRGWQYRDGRWR